MIIKAYFVRFVVAAFVEMSCTVYGTPKLSKYGWIKCWKSEYLALVELTSTIASAPVVAPEMGRTAANPTTDAKIVSEVLPTRRNKLFRSVGRTSLWTMAKERITPSEECCIANGGLVTASVLF